MRRGVGSRWGGDTERHAQRPLMNRDSQGVDTPSREERPAELLKPADVARRLRVSRSWVYAAAAANRLPAVRLGAPDGPLRFVPQDIEDWLEVSRARWTPGRASTDGSGKPR